MVAELEELARQVEADYEAAKVRRDELEAEAERRKERLGAIPGEIAGARSELQRLEARSEPGELSELDALKPVAARLLLERSLDLYDAEREFYREAGELLATRRDLAAAQSEGLRKLAAGAQGRVDSRREEMAREAAEEAAGRADDPALVPELAMLAAESARLAQMRTGTGGVTTKIAEANRELANQRVLLERIERHQADTAKQVKLIESADMSLGPGMGELLRTEKQQLPGVRGIRDEVRAGVEDLTAAQRDIVTFENQRRDQVAGIEGASAELSARVGDEHAAQARQLLDERLVHLNQLLEDYRTYSNSLRDTLDVRRQIIARVREYTDFIEQRVFWVRSAPSLHAADFTGGGTAIGRLFSPGGWGEFGRLLLGDLREHWFLWALAIFILAYLVRYRPRHRQRLAAVGEVAAKRNCRAYLPTLQALLYTLLIAVPIPLVVGFLYWRSTEAVPAGSWAEMICRVLRAIATPTAALAIARGVCRPKGLVQAHLGLGAEGRTCCSRDSRGRWS